MKNQNEYEKRCKAIQLYKEGIGFNKILQLVQRGRGWLSKWLKRYKESGFEGLKDRLRVPKRIWRKTTEYMVKKVLSIRVELESHKTRRSAFAGIGAEVIHWELKQRQVSNVPSIPTIERILSRHGKTGKLKTKRNNNNQPYPYFKAETVGDLHQTDLVGPRHLRGPKGVTRFYSFHTVDVAGHTASTSQFTGKQTIPLCKHLVGTWQSICIPQVSQMDNEMAATGGGRYPYSLSQVIRLHLLLGIHLVFIPQGEPGRNASVESFNKLWQERVLRRHNCPTLTALRRTSERFLRYYHYEKPHRSLTQKEHGTRFPGMLRDRLWKSLRHLPKGFILERYIDSNGHLDLPIAKGKVSFIRKVDSRGKIEVNGSAYFIKRRLEGQYVVAAIFTHRKRLVVKQENRIIKSFSFPIEGHIIDPLVPHRKRKSLIKFTML
ncbi:MAG: integrase core domain-containing protein [Planctomycetota bacterium]|nr:integrase core domain-containing protein [Planctomycetota bacterium]MDI6784055.1 integrase core domain-containing protein [bacterium]